MKSQKSVGKRLRTKIAWVGLSAGLWLGCESSPTAPKAENMALQEVLATLPSGFCADTSLPVPPDSSTDLSSFTEIRSGNAWEYLRTDSKSSSYQGLTGDWRLQQGWTKFAIGDTLSSGPCLLFRLAETDSLFIGTHITKNYSEMDTTAISGQVGSLFSIGVKKGAQIYRWIPDGKDTVLSGPETASIAWPFTSGYTRLRPGEPGNGNEIYDHLGYATVGTVVYLEYVSGEGGFGLSQGYEASIAKGLGMVYGTASHHYMFGSGDDALNLELFRYNGAIIDPDVFERFKNLIR